MSYDLTIWCTRPFDAPALLPSSDQWTIDLRSWSYEAGTWMINTGPSDRVLDDDIPDEVRGLLPGIEHLVAVSLEPLGAPKAGLAMLHRVARAISAEAHGVIVDPQADTVALPDGVERTVTPKKRGKQERFALLQMSWWLAHDRLLDAVHLQQFLDLLATHLPEALPRRYGGYEPPQHVYAETGRAHLVAFLADHLTSSVVWYAERPVSHWSFSLDRSCGWRPLGPRQQYRCNHLSIDLDSVALEQPGWPDRLRRFWREVSLLVAPFFGDVRTLHGYTGRPPSVGVDAQTEQHPTASWWWKGVPPRLGHAIVVGEPYLALWPRLPPAAAEDRGLVFATTPDWSRDDDLADTLAVPPEIALPFMPHLQPEDHGGMAMHYPETYPEQFPFGPLPPGVATHRRKAGWRFWRR